jgi:type II secretory pathway component PulM
MKIQLIVLLAVVFLIFWFKPKNEEIQQQQTAAPNINQSIIDLITNLRNRG